MATYSIKGECYQCTICGRYFYTHEGGGALMGTRCPFFCRRPGGDGTAKLVGYVKIIKYI